MFILYLSHAELSESYPFITFTKVSLFCVLLALSLCVYICICITPTVKIVCRNWFRGFLFAYVWQQLFILFCFCGQWVLGPPTRPTASYWLRTPLRMKAKWSQEFAPCVLEHLLKQTGLGVKRKRVKGNFCQDLVWQWMKRIVLNRPKQIEIYNLSG